jgi:hypothetical protein
MPVATQASLKGLTPDQLEEQGCRHAGLRSLIPNDIIRPLYISRLSRTCRCSHSLQWCLCSGSGGCIYDKDGVCLVRRSYTYGLLIVHRHFISFLSSPSPTPSLLFSSPINTMSTPPLNILISGSGIAGPCTALWLTRFLPTCQITILERAPNHGSAAKQSTYALHVCLSSRRWDCLRR